MKYLVDTTTGLIRGSYRPPLNFSVSSRYVMDVPDSLGVQAQTSSVADLITAKLNGFQVAHPTLVGNVFDELLATPAVDIAQSSRILTGPNKRTAILPGGVLVTTVQTIAPSFTMVFGHWNLFTLFSDPGPVTATPAPPRLLYNFSAGVFAEIPPSIMTVEIRNSINTSTLATLAPDTAVNFAGGPAFSFRLRFTNNDALKTYHLSDWVLLYG